MHCGCAAPAVAINQAQVVAQDLTLPLNSTDTSGPQHDATHTLKPSGSKSLSCRLPVKTVVQGKCARSSWRIVHRKDVAALAGPAGEPLAERHRCA